MDDAFAHDDAEAERTPVILLQCIENAVANVIIVGGRIGDLAGETGYRLQQVGARHDADDLVSAYHRQTLDVVLLHHLHDLLQRRILGNGERLRRHDLGDRATMLVNEIGCSFARAENECQPAGALALRADFTTANEITLRYDTDEFAGRVDHRKPADMLPQHGVCGFDDRGLRRNCDDRAVHYLMRAHWGLRGFEIATEFRKAIPASAPRFDPGQGRPEIPSGLMQLNMQTGARSYSLRRDAGTGGHHVTAIGTKCRNW